MFASLKDCHVQPNPGTDPRTAVPLPPPHRRWHRSGQGRAFLQLQQLKLSSRSGRYKSKLCLGWAEQIGRLALKIRTVKCIAIILETDVCFSSKEETGMETGLDGRQWLNQRAHPQQCSLIRNYVSCCPPRPSPITPAPCQTQSPAWLTCESRSLQRPESDTQPLSCSCPALHPTHLFSDTKC